MSGGKYTNGSIRVCVVVIALSTAFGSLATLSQHLSAQEQNASGTQYPSKRMADGKEWTTHNLEPQRHAVLLLRRCGTEFPPVWSSIHLGISAPRLPILGEGWRLPTDDEWRQLAKHYGGVSEDSDDRGKAAYKALLAGGNSGFDALLGGGRSGDGQYARLEAHGFYWTASESDQASGWFYNFGRGAQGLHRQSGGEKQRAFSVRCVRD
jgi:uncharacterized protein (TIGR02145 family)